MVDKIKEEDNLTDYQLETISYFKEKLKDDAKKFKKEFGMTFDEYVVSQDYKDDLDFRKFLAEKRKKEKEEFIKSNKKNGF